MSCDKAKMYRYFTYYKNGTRMGLKFPFLEL